MKFTVSSMKLFNHLSSVNRVINSKNTLPILDCFLFKLQEGTLTITASDSETTLVTSIEVDSSDEDGVVAIGAKTLLDSLKEIPEQPITFEISGPTVVMPSSNAGYLNNPRPAYPSISRRMGEEGKVMLRVYVNTQGLPEQIELQQSSGFERLDKAAMDAVRRWKFVPGTRNGVPEAMWNIVPINFVLE